MEYTSAFFFCSFHATSFSFAHSMLIDDRKNFLLYAVFSASLLQRQISITTQKLNLKNLFLSNVCKKNFSQNSNWLPVASKKVVFTHTLFTSIISLFTFFFHIFPRINHEAGGKNISLHLISCTPLNDFSFSRALLSNSSMTHSNFSPNIMKRLANMHS